MYESDNIHTLPIGTRRPHFSFDAFDKLVGDALAEDHTMAQEGSFTADIEDAAFTGLISRDDAETVLRAFHERLHEHTI